ncbi:Transposase and inactivated derivatives [Moraxella cuniculi]|uniref:Transposase and inactivated derivatives n=1 Tax=Moraxella cuniculi TaxID=34061 RepID=A0A3S4SYR6_9GAMM|nr:Transposase and inactivated derivatives [Moraxella cuniculi]
MWLLLKISSKVKPDSIIIYTDSYKSYHAFDVNDFKHFRTNHSKEFSKDCNHINGIENFWLQAKQVLRKYNGIDKKNIHLFIQGM